MSSEGVAQAGFCHPSPRAGGRLWRLFAGAGVVIAGVVALAGWMIADARQVVWNHAVQSSENLLGALDHDIQQNFQVYDLSLQSVIEGLRLPDIWSISPELRQYVLFDRAAGLQHFGSIIVLDKTGRVMVQSRGTIPPDTSFRDRNYFTVHRDHPDRGLFISAPFKAHISGEWSIAISRRLNEPDGGFAGVVAGTVRLTFFRQLFETIDSGRDGTISVICTDGKLVVRKPFNEKDIGRDLGKAGIFRDFPRSRSGHIEDVDLIDGVRRLFAYRQIGDLPFILTVAVSSDAVLAEWRQKATIIGALVLGLALLAALLGVTLMSELRRRGVAEKTAVESERRLADKSAILEATLENMDQGLLLIAADRTVPVHNRRVIELLELPAALMATQPRFDEILEHQFRQGEFQGTEHAFRAWVRSGGVAETHQIYERRRPNGTVLEIRTVPLRGGGGVRTFTDITRRKMAEAELASAKQQAESAAMEAERAREQAELASRSKSEFLANMSHELRTPLNAVIGFAEIIRDAVMGPVDARYRDYARDICNSGTHLLSLINDVLDLSKIEVGRLELNEDTVDVAKTITACSQIMAPRASEAELDLVFELSPDIPLMHADERRLKQIVLNLLSNALKFTPAGGRVVVSARPLPNGEIRIAVSDSGIGMKPEDVSLALEPFRQIDSVFNRRYQGTGLGLPLVQRLASLHGGELAIETAPGAGTTVIVILPADRCIRDVA